MLELWDRHRQSHEKPVLVVNTSVVLKEHRDTVILIDDRLRMKASHEVECEMLIDDMRPHDLDDGWYLCNLLEEHEYHS
jgi:hypothetical protein